LIDRRCAAVDEVAHAVGKEIHARGGQSGQGGQDGPSISLQRPLRPPGSITRKLPLMPLKCPLSHSWLCSGLIFQSILTQIILLRLLCCGIDCLDILA
jgi:hypothetical protein